MEIGDPERKANKAVLMLDAITDTRTGALLSPTEMARGLSAKRLVLVGESHTDINFHRAQLRIIEELHRAGRQVALGLEMFPYPKQEFLTAWGYRWNYYRDIFVFARDNAIPVYALNTPRAIISAVRKKAWMS